MFVNTFWSLVPPIVAIGLALLTKETYSSLFIGIVVGALLATDFSPIGALDTIINDGLTAAIADNAGIFLFLVILGVMVALVNATGGSAAFGRWAASHIHSKAGALLATFALGVLIFIDDYFNCLTVGSVMTPVTDSQRISRVKLAYLIDATAAPICMIAPISSWAAAVSGVAAKLDTGVSGIQLFIEAIPYNFYSLLTIVFVITMVVLGVDYGPMAAAELKAAQTGDLGALSDEHEEGSSRANIRNMSEDTCDRTLHIVEIRLGIRQYLFGFFHFGRGNHIHGIGNFHCVLNTVDPAFYFSCICHKFLLPFTVNIGNRDGILYT